MEDKRIRIMKRYYIPLAVFSILIILSIFYFVRDSFLVQKNGIFTIGVVTDYIYYGRTSSLYYSFYYEGIKYTGGTSAAVFSKSDIGKRYYVQFLKNNIKRNIMLGKPVPDCITEAPPEGWIIIPECRSDNREIH